MNTEIEKTLDYRCFLLGIIIYWMVEAVWESFTPCFFYLEAVLHPIVVVVGKSLLFLLIFFLLFRKPRMFNVGWMHIAIFLGIVVLMNLLSSFLSYRFLDLQSFSANQAKWDIADYMMRNVRIWVNLVSSLLFIGFVWWRYDSEANVDTQEISSLESRSYYGGILFSITLGYILSLIRVLGGEYWTYTSHPILVDVIICVLIILVTIGAIFMLVKRKTVVLSITAIFIIIAIHFFTSYYLPNILSKNLIPNPNPFQQICFFTPVAVVCSIAFNLAAFILYRKRQIL